MREMWFKSTASYTSGCLEARWSKSSASGLVNCVEAAWLKSPTSGLSDCVEVADDDGRVLVRDSKLGDESPVLEFTPVEWEAFLIGVRNGEFDIKS